MHAERSRPDGASDRWRRARFGPLFLLPALLAVVGYGFTLGDFFLSDDFAHLHKAAGASGWVEAASLDGNWKQNWLRPLPLWSWWINFQCFGLHPFGYRLFNLAFHALNSGLVAWFVVQITKDTGAGAIAGSAFAVVPNHAEAVTWICARYDLLCTTGVLVCLLAWTRFLCRGGKISHLVIASLGMAWALASKEMALSLPLLAGVVAVGLFRPPPRQAYAGLAVLSVLVGSYLLLRVEALGGMGGRVTFDGQSLLTKLPSLSSATEFLRQAFVGSFAPAHRQLHPEMWHPLKTLPLLAVVLGLIAGFRSGRSRRMFQTAWPLLLLFLLSLVPLFGWGFIGDDNQSTRYLYLPTIFSCAILGASIHLARITSQKACAALAFLAIGAWSVGLVLENRNWQEAARIAESMVETLPVPEPETGSALVVTGLPDNHHGAFVFRNSFHHAVGLFTGYEGQVYSAPSRRYWKRQRRRARRASSEGIFFYRWDSVTGRWSDSPQ